MTKVTPKEKFNLGNRIRLDKNLSPAARLVGWYIADHVHTKRGYAWPPQEKIASDLGLGDRTVRRAITALAPHFDIDRSQRQHEYRIPTPAKMACITPATPAKMATIPAKMAAHTGQNGRPSFNYPIKHPLKDSSSSIDDGFSKFWESYPRKVAKKAAEKAFARAVKETTLEQMLAALAIDKQDWREERFTPHPATWLNQGRYLDHQDKLKPIKTYRPPDYRDD